MSMESGRAAMWAGMGITDTFERMADSNGRSSNGFNEAKITTIIPVVEDMCDDYPEEDETPATLTRRQFLLVDEALGRLK